MARADLFEVSADGSQSGRCSLTAKQLMAIVIIRRRMANELMSINTVWPPVERGSRSSHAARCDNVAAKLLYLAAQALALACS